MALQEVSIAKHQIPSAAAELRAHDATVIFSPLGDGVLGLQDWAQEPLLFAVSLDGSSY